MARRKSVSPVANQGPEVEESSLGGLIGRELRNSLTYDQTQISTKRAVTLEYVRGIMPDLPGRPNGSQQTSRDISDVMSWMLPGIMRTMTASDQMVRYEQVKDENPAWAEQATAYMNWSFFYDNDGYRNLYNGTYDSLAMGNGVIRCDFEPEQTRTERLKGQTLPDVVGIVQQEQDGELRLLSQAEGEPKEVEIDGPDGKPVTVKMPTFDIKVEHILSKGRICDETCKPENLLINAAATTLEDARFVAYLHDDWTRSDLLEMGFDKDMVEGLAPGPNFARNQVELARRFELTTNWQSPVRSGDRISTYECYVKYDFDGDGIAEMGHVWYAGEIGAGTVLGWDYWDDEVPFTDIPCYPLPHRWDAESVADRMMDIRQRVNTVLTRALLDSTYASNVPQRAVTVEGSVLNPDALVNPRFGSTIWIKEGHDGRRCHSPARDERTRATRPIAAMRFMGDMITKRTGISRQTMALDPDALTNQTATAARDLRDAGYSQVELIARNPSRTRLDEAWPQAPETGDQAQDAGAHQAPSVPGAATATRDLPSDSPKFQQIDASQWDENMAVSINTGLGTGSRDRDMAMLKVMMDGQVGMAQQLAATGLPTAKVKALQFLPKILNSAVLLAESAGIKNPTEHYPDITDADVQQMVKEAQQMAQQGSPEQGLIQMKMQGEQQANQSAQQLAAIKLQSEQQASQASIQIAQVKSQAEVQKSQYDLQVKQLAVQEASQTLQYQDQIAGLRLQLDAAKADADNETKLRSQALNNLTQIIVAGLNNKAALDTVQVEGWLESIIGIQKARAEQGNGQSQRGPCASAAAEWSSTMNNEPIPFVDGPLEGGSACITDVAHVTVIRLILPSGEDVSYGLFEEFEGTQRKQARKQRVASKPVRG